MTEKARRPDGEEKRDKREYLPTERSHELGSERDLAETPLDAINTTDTMEETEEIDPVGASEAESAASASERARTRRASRKTVMTPTSAAEAPAAETREVAVLSAIEADRIELEAQGFTPEEAERLIEVTKRLETSAEALASQAELKRLRFAQWLFERGRLDEFSV